MAFPLAHPAAALAFRRVCPKHLSFAGLVIGSVTPDLAACMDWEYFSHTLLGSFVFCLPVGIISLFVLYEVRAPLAATLPNPHREALLPLCYAPFNSIFACVASLLIGSWIHIGWDLLTHDHSWLAQSMGSWSISLPHFGTRQLKLSQLLWLVSSLAGSALVLASYFSLLRSTKEPVRVLHPDGWRPYAIWLAILLVPLLIGLPLALQVPEAARDISFFIRVWAMFYLGCLWVTLAIVGVFLRIGGYFRKSLPRT